MTTKHAVFYAAILCGCGIYVAIWANPIMAWYIKIFLTGLATFMGAMALDLIWGVVKNEEN